MSAKSLFLGSLVLALASLGTSRGQEMSPPYGDQALPQADSAAGEAVPPPPGPPATLSKWILYPRAPGCCEPVGKNGPIGAEVYLRGGPSFPVGGGDLNNILETGWVIQGGARSLFFNPSTDSAWVIDLSITNVHNNVRNNPHPVTLRDVPSRSSTGQQTTVPFIDVNVAGLNRTLVGLSLGQEHYLWGGAEQTGVCSMWRAGWDVGGRYGSAKAEFAEIQHITDTIGGFFIALHSDLEIPCGGCIFQAGVRTEYSYTWSDVLLRGNNADLQDFSLLFTLGLRF